MRIGFNTFQLHRRITGAGRFAKNLLRALAELDDENEYVIFLRKDNANYYSLEKPNFKNVITGVSRKIRVKRILAEQFKLPKLAKEHNIDIFWSPSDIAPRNLHCPSIATIHDLKRFVLPQEFPFLERTYYKWFVRQTAQNSNLIFTVSESSGRDIMKHLDIPAERIVVAHNGVDPDILAEEEGLPLESLKRIHGIPDEYILFVGQMIKSKNVPRMIRAFVKCKAANNHHFVLVGQSGAGMHEIEQTIRREHTSENKLRERIHHVKWAPAEQLVSFYKNASALFFASLYEGFGFPLVEAMACGAPIITSDRSSMPEVAGDAAILVNPNDEEAMTQALNKILTDDWLRSHLILKGKIRVNFFSWENTARKYMAVWERLKKSL